MRFTLATLALMAMTACNVTTPPSTTLKPFTPNVPNTPSPYDLVTGNGAGLAGTVLGSDPVNTVVTSITFNGTPLANVVKQNTGTATYGRAQLADGLAFEVVGFSDDGKASAGASEVINASTIATSTGSTAGFGQIATYSRATNSVMRSSGSGTYVGDYRGTIGKDGGSYNGTNPAGAIVAIQGVVTLNASFGSNPTVGGKITSRRTLLSNGNLDLSLGKLTLDQSAINGNGLFGSTVSGPTTGQYEGLFGGQNGTGIAGAISLIDNNGFTEVGVFSGTLQ